MNYIRICPTCKKDIIYTNKESFRICSKNNTNCRSCGLEFRKQNKIKNKTDKIKPEYDLTGKQINCWNILNFSHRKKQQIYWSVECMNCKFTCDKEVSHINKTKSCRNCRMMKKGESGSNRLYSIYKRHANTHKREFTLELEKFRILTTSNCFYCNAIPKNRISNSNPGKISYWGEYVYNGIDRVDNSIGYITENCVPCCEICNWAKSNKGIKEFEKYIINICKNAINGTIPFILKKDLNENSINF